jgi:poly(A) polymerase
MKGHKDQNGILVPAHARTLAVNVGPIAPVPASVHPGDSIPCPSGPLDLPGVPPFFWASLLAVAGSDRIALVGGAVRDWLLHHQHLDPWRGLLDLDLVIEDLSAVGSPAGMGRSRRTSPAWQLVENLSRAGEGLIVRDARPHGQYGTVELELALHSPGFHAGGSSLPLSLLLDVASARRETYPVAGDNPVVHYGALEDDLARRDLTINAMAIELSSGTLLDPHGGRDDLAARQLRFLHPTSLRDDPTRLVRAARYASRLGFQLAEESQSQATSTLAAWPWPWRAGDAPGKAPAALGTRLRRELELLLERENWWLALRSLQGWGGLILFDLHLQNDCQWMRRLHWASRFHLPRMVAFLAGAEDPLLLAERLQVPRRQHLLLSQCLEVRRRLGDGGPWTEGESSPGPWQWCQFLEAPGLSPQAVALALACGVAPRRPLLRWLLRWRHLGPERSARDLMDAGVPKGPELGKELKRSRQERLERERL